MVTISVSGNAESYGDKFQKGINCLISEFAANFILDAVCRVKSTSISMNFFRVSDQMFADIF